MTVGRGDKVQCCVCNVYLGNWKEHDDPCNEHAQYAPDCPLVRHKRKMDNHQVRNSKHLNMIKSYVFLLKTC